MLIAKNGEHHLARCLMTCALHIVIAALPLGTQAASVPQTSVAVAPLSGNIPGPFEEQLIPSRDVSLAEREALANAVRAYDILIPENVATLEEYLSAHPDSPYRFALRTNMGLVFYRYGYFSRAMAEWQTVWQQREAARGTPAKPLVDRAVGELIKMNARLGRAPVVETLMAEASPYRIAGPAVESIAGALQGLYLMKKQPGVAYLCGPHALRNALQSAGVTGSSLNPIHAYRSPQGGVTLGQVAELAKQIGQPWQPVYRESAATVPVPSVIHWKLNHYAAVVGFDGKRYHPLGTTCGSRLRRYSLRPVDFSWLPLPRLANLAGAWRARRSWRQ